MNDNCSLLYRLVLIEHEYYRSVLESFLLCFYITFKCTLITPAPVCANMIQILVHTCRDLGCSIFIKTNVKRRSNPSPLKVFNIQHCLAYIHLFSQAQLFQNIISKSVCLLGTTAGVIRVKKRLHEKHLLLLKYHYTTVGILCTVYVLYTFAILFLTVLIGQVQ